MVMSTLDELAVRVDHYDKRIADLKSQIAECEARKAKLLSSIQVIKSELGSKSSEGKSSAASKRADFANIRKLDDRILAVLRYEALETNDLKSELERQWPQDAPVNIASMRTYLSGFRKAGVVDRIRKKWHLL